MGGADLVGVLEAAYTLDGDDRAWLQRVVEGTRAAVAPRSGVIGYYFDAGRPEYVEPIEPIVLGVRDDLAQAVAQGLVASGPMIRDLDDTPIATASSSLGDTWLQVLPMLKGVLTEAGVEDVLAVRTEDPSRRGCVVGIGLPEMRTLKRGELGTWRRVAAHVAAALRLRRRGVSAEAADAVLTPDGRAVDARGAAKGREAREALREAARAIDRARTRVRRASNDEAVEMWRALVAGQWSLVDAFEHDGRRYVLAHKNAPRANGRESLARRLSEREQQVVAYASFGHSNKLIAYELGIATSTVAAYLASAAKKLGATSRVTLIRMAREAV